ncbi:uncharacterized protein V3H82_018798 [Fundulus diaphanus]
MSSSEESSDKDHEEPGPSRHSVSARPRSAARDASLEIKKMFRESSEDDDSGDDRDFKVVSETPKAKQKPTKSSSTKSTFFTAKNHCYVCGKGMRKISRHLKKHADEVPEIAEAFSFPPLSSERTKLLYILRNRGNYLHNQEVLAGSAGSLKVQRRRKTNETNSASLAYCPYCKILMERVTMWRHVPNCVERMSETAAAANKSFISDSEESESGQKMLPDAKKILSGMKRDKTTLVVQKDDLLVQLAKSFCRKYRNDPGKVPYIQDKLREMGKVLLEMHKMNILTFEEALQPKNFSSVVRSVRKVVGFDLETQTYVKRGLAFNLGVSLKSLAKIVLNGQNTDDTTRSSAKMFVEKCVNEWGGLVSDTTSASSKGQKVSSPSTIPFTRDVQAFHAYLERLAASATDSLKTSEDAHVYNVLSRVTLAQVSVLSKRTSGVSEMTLKSFEQRGDSTKVLSKHFIRINVVSRSGADVAVLLTSQLVSALSLLISKRRACGVHEDNPFLFAKPDASATSHYHGGHCIKSFSGLCHAENPENLTAAHLSKHTARIFQILNLENDELEHLRELLGHEIRTNRDYYQSPEAAVELAKISKLLLAKEKGSLGRFKGNSLEEVEIEDELKSDGEQSSGGEDAEKSNAQPGSPLQQSDVAEQLDGPPAAAVQDALEHIKAKKDKPSLQERFIDSVKEKGVFANESIEPSSFVVEFRGKICARQESSETEGGDSLNNYVFDFSWKGTNWCVDASAEDGSLGRLVNDDHLNPNCKVMKISCEEKPHLCLFALRQISPGEEITFSYGDSSYSWRSTETTEDVNVPEKDPAPPVDEDLEDSAADSLGSAQSSGDEYVCDEQPDSDDSVSSSDPEEDQTRCGSDDSDSDAPSKRTSLTRKNYCYVCGRPQTKISRHLFTHRGEEPEIAEVFALRRNSKERKKLLNHLRGRGNLTHNKEVLRTRKGKLKVRTQSQMSTLKNLAACIYCKVLFSRSVLWRHLQKCPLRISTPLRGRTQILALVASGLTEPDKSSGVRKMLKRMKEDETSVSALQDPYLPQLACCLYHMLQGKNKEADISRKLRQMGRLLAALKEKSIVSFEEALKPQNFNSVVEAVRSVSTLNVNSKRYSESVTSLLGKVGNIKYARVLNDNADKEAIEEAEEFLKLCEKQWPKMKITQQNVPGAETLPFIRDVQLLFGYITTSVASAVETLTKFQSPPVYSALLRGVAAYVAVLNRKNAHLAQVTLQSFLQRNQAPPPEENDGGQQPFEKILSERIVKMAAVCQENRKVVLSLTPELLSAVTMLVERRKQCGVPDGNPYLFGRPVASPSSVCKPQQTVPSFVGLCGAKGVADLRSPFFRKYVAQIFQILLLGDEQLGQLATLLGRGVRTDSEFYRSPEAAADIARILVLLSAVEGECLDIFQGKSMEEIGIPDELQPVVEPISRAEEDEAEASPQVDGASPSTSQKKGKRSSTKNRAKSKKRESKEDTTGGKNEEENTEKDEEAAKIPQQGDVDAPEETQTRKKEAPAGSETTAAPNKHNESQIYFSDDDEDMNVDFNMDIDIDDDDDDEVRNEETKAAENSEANLGGQDKAKESETLKGGSCEAAVETDRRSGADGDDEEADQDDWMDADSGGSSPVRTVAEERSSSFKAAMMRMKEIKILIRKLNVDNLQTPIQASQLTLNEIQPENDQRSPAAAEERKLTSTSPEETNKQRDDKAVMMNCSLCKKIMTKGQTAYQKKGFTDVFCSKDCLFEMFPTNKAAPRTCYYCFREILQLLDLIMAVVDLKGTTKDFCSPSCLCNFKSSSASVKSQPARQRNLTSMSSQALSSLCSTCDRICANPVELKLDECLRSFCSDACLETFCRKNVGVCDHCGSPCRGKRLRLRLEDGTKTVCGPDCLEEFKKNIMAAQECPVCGASQLPSDMVSFKNSENLVELLCSRDCLVSFKALPVPRPEPASSLVLETDDTARLVVGSGEASCCCCGRKLKKASAVFHLKKAKQAFCSEACVTEKHPHVQFDTKTCYSCLQLITQPQKVILAPVDDSGTVKELCSDACLSAVKAKLLFSHCKLCGKYSPCKFSVTVDGEVQRLCSSSCASELRRENKCSWFCCAACGALSSGTRLTLQTEDGERTVCGDECLVKIKESVKTRQLCSTCRTPHHMSDMVESKNSEARLDLFCSHRCLKVHKAQSLTVPENLSVESEEMDVKEVKPSLSSLPHIKEEPVDQGYFQNRSHSVSPQSIKEEPNVQKDLKIGSVFSLTEDTKPPLPAPAHQDLPASCSSCQRVLMDGETVYQRKAHSDLFCSTSCLLSFYELKSVKTTCHFCLQVIVKPQSVLQAAVDNKGTKKDFCSQSCLSSFNYKRILSADLPVLPAASQSQCSVCSRFCISKREITLQGAAHKVCSEPCLRRFCNINKLLVCESCGSRCDSPLRLQTDAGVKSLCGAECLKLFKQKFQTPQPCSMCCTSKLMSDMTENKNSKDVIELFCSSSCIMASKIQAVCASGVPLSCDNCGKKSAPACHLAASDGSVRNFCCLTCAMAFKETQKDQITRTNGAEPGRRTLNQIPEELLCAECQQVIKAAPTVIQNKNRLVFVCSLACSQEFKKRHKILGVCARCRDNGVVNEVKRIDGKDCSFCSDGCFRLFQRELDKKWGKHCPSCAFCLCVSRTVLPARGKGKKKLFCSEGCRSKYKTLVSDEARCDACGRRGKLTETLALPGNVTHFCDLRCLLDFRNNEEQTLAAGSPPPGSASPVITSVVSLSGGPAGRASPLGSFSDIQTKVVGHAGVQTAPRELKNKSTLCVPLVHNKGVCCCVHTVETASQTVTFKPKVQQVLSAVPVPVPVYAPLPMNLYSQFTPVPLVLPVPLPVPVFLPEKKADPRPTATQETQTEFSCGAERRTEPEDGKKEEEQERQTPSLIETINSYMDDLGTDYQPGFNHRDLDLEFFSPPETCSTAPPDPEANVPRGRPPDLPPSAEAEAPDLQSSLIPLPAAGSAAETPGNVQNINEGGNVPEEAEEKMLHAGSAELVLDGRCGVDTWRRWIQWRESQTSLGLLPASAGSLKADLLQCSSSELSEGLSLFISEVKHPQGDPCSPDILFYMCLSIQQYLFENSRVENIFTDPNHQKFSSEFTRILKSSPSARRSLPSCVKEEFLWGCKQLGAYSPIVLLNTLLFFCCKNFGFTTVEQHRQLSFAHVTRCTKTNADNTKTTFLRFYLPEPGNAAETGSKQGDGSDVVPAKKRRLNKRFLDMKENLENPLRCPVRLYEFYLSKCSESVKRRSDVFYLQPNSRCLPSSPVWFSLAPLDSATMEAAIVRSLAVRELQDAARGGR